MKERKIAVKIMLFKFVVFSQNYRNTSGSLKEREIVALNYVIQICCVSIEL